MASTSNTNMTVEASLASSESSESSESSASDSAVASSSARKQKQKQKQKKKPKKPKKPVATATAAALEYIHAEYNSDSITIRTPSLSSQSTSEPVAPEDSNLLSQTVKDIKEVAKESYAGWKEWASSPGNPWSSSPIRSNRQICHAEKQQQQHQQQPWYHISSNAGDNSDGATNNQETAAKLAIQDLISPFMACHRGGTIEDTTADADVVTDTPYNNDHYAYRLSEEIVQLKERVFMLSEADSHTIVSMDTAAEDEMMQLQRLTSWGTNGTNNSHGSAISYVTNTTDADAAPLDDDGHVIPQVLIQSAQKRREARKATTRKRVVRFDYPPISSLRECPRPDPNDLPDLFFTEEELNEIEADRTSTIIADDIEIVAVGSSKSIASSSSLESPESAEAATTTNDHMFGEYPSSPAPNKLLQRKPRSSSPHPQRPAKGSWSNDGNDRYNNSTAKNEHSGSDPRLIKGVQIYLRERSTGKGTR